MHPIPDNVQNDQAGTPPAKVIAAQNYLYYANGVRNPQTPLSLSGDTPTGGEELSPKEQAAYNAALDVLIAYFRGEMDFGDTNPGTIQETDDDDPKEPVHVG